MVVGMIVRVGMSVFVVMAIIVRMLAPGSKIFSKQPNSKDYSQDAAF